MMIVVTIVGCVTEWAVPDPAVALVTLAVPVALVPVTLVAPVLRAEVWIRPVTIPDAPVLNAW